METPVDDVTAKVESSLVLEKGDGDDSKKDEEVGEEVEPKSGVSFPVEMSDGKKLFGLGLRKKAFLGIGFKIYAFGNLFHFAYIHLYVVMYILMCLRSTLV